MFEAEAPNTFRIPISLLLLATLNETKPSTPVNTIKIISTTAMAEAF